MKTKHSYQFKLTIKNVDENTPDIEDILFEAGCDDALINFRNGAVFLEFDRKSTSLEEAVISAIKDIKSAPIDVEVANVGPEDLVTESEIGKRLGKSRQTISLWIKGKRRKSFPCPIMRISEKSPLWSWNQVVTWLYDNKLIRDYKIVDQALFLANINAALEEQDKKTREIRHYLLARIL